MARRTTVGAACTLAAAALVLTACGGGGDKKVAATTSGAPAGAPSAGATTAPATTSAPAGPTFDFPPDVSVVVDADTTGDAAKDAVLRDQGYGLRAIYLSVAELNSKLPVFSRYLTRDAAKTWIDSIAWGQRYHRTVTGPLRFYDREVTLRDAKTAAVTFCEDQSRSYDKDSRSGKVFTTTTSADSLVSHTASLRKSADGTWQMTTYTSQRGAAQCRL